MIKHVFWAGGSPFTSSSCFRPGSLSLAKNGTKFFTKEREEEREIESERERKEGETEETRDPVQRP